MSFWSDFLSNLAATVVGVVIGLRATIWLNRKEERAKVTHSLDVLQIAIDANRPRLQRVRAVVAAGNSLFDAGLDTAAWEAVQGGLTSTLGNPALRQHLAYHFVRLTGLTKMMETLVSLATRESQTAPVMNAKQPLANGIVQAATELDVDAGKLVEELKAARESFSAVARGT